MIVTPVIVFFTLQKKLRSGAIVTSLTILVHSRFSAMVGKVGFADRLTRSFP